MLVATTWKNSLLSPIYKNLSDAYASDSDVHVNYIGKTRIFWLLSAHHYPLILGKLAA